MPDNAEFGRRLRDAKREYEMRHDRDLSWRELGERIGAAMGREPYVAEVVRRWFQMGREPAEFAITEAIARVLETDPRVLAFGPAEPPAPPARAAPPPPVRVAHPDAFVPSPRPVRNGAGDGPTAADDAPPQAAEGTNGGGAGDPAPPRRRRKSGG